MNWFLMALCLLITVTFGLQLGKTVVIIGEPLEVRLAGWPSPSRGK